MDGTQFRDGQAPAGLLWSTGSIIHHGWAWRFEGGSPSARMAPGPGRTPVRYSRAPCCQPRPLGNRESSGRLGFLRRQRVQQHARSSIGVVQPWVPMLGSSCLHHDRAETPNWPRHWCAAAAEVERRRSRAWAKALPRLGFILPGPGASGWFGNALVALPSRRPQKQSRLPASSAAAPEFVPLSPCLSLSSSHCHPFARLPASYSPLSAGGVTRWPPPFSLPCAPSRRPPRPCN